MIPWIFVPIAAISGFVLAVWCLREGLYSSNSTMFERPDPDTRAPDLYKLTSYSGYRPKEGGALDLEDPPHVTSVLDQPK